MKFIVGKKLGMSQVYGENGNVIPVTVLEAEPNTIVQIKNNEKDKYESVQIGYGTKKEKNIRMPQKGHYKKLGNFAGLKEFKINSKGKKSRGEDQVPMSPDMVVGHKIDVSIFVPGDTVKITGLTKGRGFQGAVKRHGFSGMPAGHGHHSVMRHVGSIGQRFPQHTLKGMRMAGRMGHAKFTVRGLKVVSVDQENNLVAVKGAVPGNKGGMVIIQSQ
jgi:large subunit ribosomal protein L3